MLDNFKYFLNSEVVGRLQPLGVSAPWHWLTVFGVGFKLKQRVVYAVKQYFIMDVLTLSNESGGDLFRACFTLTLGFFLICKHFLPCLFTTFFKC